MSEVGRRLVAIGELLSSTRRARGGGGPAMTGCRHFFITVPCVVCVRILMISDMIHLEYEYEIYFQPAS